MFDIQGFVYRWFEDVYPYGNPASDLSVPCPFCENRIGDPDSRHHLNISIDKHVVHCFRCSYKNSWINFIIDVTGYPYHRAIGELYHPPRMVEFADTIKSSFEKSPQRAVEGAFSLPDDFIPLPEATNSDGRRAIKYLINRGFNNIHWKTYGLGIAQSVPDRVIIPIEDGYWQGRSIFKWMSPRYLNPGKPSSGVLFNSAALYHYPEVVVCEGAFSAMAVGENAIALIGKEPTDEKVSRILESPVSKIIITLEPGAFSSMKKLIDAMYKNGKEVVVWNYKFGDPAEKDESHTVMDYNLKTAVELMLKRS